MTIYYIDSNRGDDANSGTSPDTPWQNLTKIDDQEANAGDQFLLANDSMWEYDIATRIVPPTSWQGTKLNPVVIGKYSPSSQSQSNQNPIIKWNRLIQENEWTYSPVDNAWVFTSPNNVGNLCLLRLANTWMASCVDSGLPLKTLDGRYFASGTSLYLYAPFHTNPTKYYGEVLLSTNAGFITISSARNWVTIQDLHFENTSTGILAYSGSNTAETGVVIQRISGNTVSGLIRAAADSSGALRAFIKNNNIINFGPTAIQAFSSTNAGFLELEIINNTIADGLHCYSQGAIYLQCRSPNFTPIVQGNKISKVRWGTPDKMQDGCAIYCETGSDNVIINANTIEDCYMAFQDNSGRTTSWTNNLVKNCWAIMAQTDAEGNDAGNITFENNTCLVGEGLITQASNGDGRNNNAFTSRKSVLEGGAITMNIRNNIFVKLGEESSRAAILTPQVGWTGVIENNCVYNFPYVAQEEFSPFTLQPNSSSYLFSPELSQSNRLKSTSNLISTGKHINIKQDSVFTTYWNPPSIGAFEYIRPKTITSTRTMRS